jgi:molybdopterin converting factor small subunit
MALRIRLKLYGIFRSAGGVDAISLDLPDGGPTVRLAISELVSRPRCGELKKLIFGEEGSDPRSSALILLGGREIGAMAGLDTRLKEDDELSLLPIAHGG